MASKPENKPSSSSTTAVVLLGLTLLVIVIGVLSLGAWRISEPKSAEKGIARLEKPADEEAESVAAKEVKEAAPEAKAEVKGVDERRDTQPLVEHQSSSPPVSEPVKFQVVGPGQAALDSSAAPPNYEKLAFQDFEEAFGGKGREDLHPWFEGTETAGFRMSQVPSPYGQSGAMEGIGRLKSPWPDGAVLRLVPYNFDGLKIHFWNGAAGVTLVYYEEGNRWAAYKTTRDGERPTPKTTVITATDDDRCRRTEFRFGGPIEIRFVGGELMLSRGDVVLLTAPFAGRPSEVFFDGRATIHGITLARTKDAPRPYRSRSEQQRTVANLRPADLDWKPREGIRGEVERQNDGAVRISGMGMEVVAALPATGLHEVVLQLENIAPGAGVYLADAEARANAVLRFCRDRKTGQIAAVISGAERPSEIDVAAFDSAPVPLVETQCYVRLLQGCGNLRWWVSTDGVHWAQTEPAKQTAVSIQNASLGLVVAANSEGASVTLKRISLRPLSGLQSLAGESTRELTYPQLEKLLDEAQLRGVSFDEQLAALDDAALISLDLRDGGAMKLGILSRYVQLGLWGADLGGLPAWSSVRQAFQSVPIYSPLQGTPDLGRAIRWELVGAAYRQEPRESLDFIQRLRRFHQQRDRGLVEWSQWLANANSDSRLVAQPRDSWRELLVEDLSKEAYNVMTELRAVLDGDAGDDAARLIAAVRPEAAVGVAPSIQDPALLTTVPVAIRLVLQEHPQIREKLADHYAATSELRISQAIRGGDVRAIELASVQFADLPAAAAAERWLGDRALGAGRFAAAIAHYQRAMQVEPEWEEEVGPRLRLAAAMQGGVGNVKDRFRGDVQIGEETITATDFEQLIAEMTERRADAPSSRVPAVAKLPKPGHYVGKSWGRFDGPVGERPQEEVLKRVGQFGVPWADRQLATEVADGMLYVANRFQVSAYDLSEGRRLWQSETPGGTMQRAQDWPLVPMRPLLTGDHVFVRLLYSTNPLLVCLDRATGKTVWTTETGEREAFISDPLLVNNQLVMLSVVREADQNWQLRQWMIQPATGDVIDRYDLVRLRSSWSARNCAQVAACGDGLVTVLGGVTLSTSADGDVRWIRKHLALPADDDPRWILQTYEPPIVDSERVYIAQPGVRTVDCLDISTGRQHWQAVLPEVLGIVGLAGEVLVVRTETDVRGLDLADGSTRWRYGKESIVGTPICDESQVLVATLPGNNGEQHQYVNFAWLAAHNGHSIATTTCQNPTEMNPRLGRFVIFQGKFLAFFSRGQQDLTRDIIELIPAAD